MDKFSSLLELHESATEEIVALLEGIRECDDYCEKEWPELAATRVKMESIATELEQLFSAALIKSVKEQIHAEEQMLDEAEAQGY